MKTITRSAAIALILGAVQPALAGGDDLVGRIEAKFANVMRKAYGWEEHAFRQFREGYRNYPADVLEEALAATTFERMQSTLDAYAALHARDTMAKAYPARKSYALNAIAPDDAANEQLMEAKALAAKSLGEDARDLVFIPVSPCTVWDTRFASGAPFGPAIANGVTRRFYSHLDGAGGNFTTFGGNPACTEANQDFIGARPYAVMMIVYVNNPVANGWLTFYRDGDPDPSQATVSVYYSPGPTRTQTVVAKSSRGYGTGTHDVAVTSRFSTADASASVVGYFIKPQATALDCTNATNTGLGASIGNGFKVNIPAPACPAGYTATGTQCDGPVGALPAGLWLQKSRTYCTWHNGTGGFFNDSVVSATTVCCRVPGR